MDSYFATGNEYVSLPKINELSGGIEDMSFLCMSLKGMIDVRCAARPLIAPFISVGGVELPLEDIALCRELWWIPVMTAGLGAHRFKMTVLCPVGERGFGLRLELLAGEDVSFDWGLSGLWASAWHCVNEDKELEGSMHCYESPWNSSLVFDMRSGAPLFAFAPMGDKPLKSEYEKGEGGISYRLSRSEALKKGETAALCIYWGLGFEEVAAATSAKELLRRGWAWEYERTAKWLKERCRRMKNERLTEIYNRNLFFCLFYSTGLTLDTEELVCVTSRSSRYYVSAAYWDRDLLLWAFPAILEADMELAGELLRHVFTRQRRNIGIHSRYIDGTVLEPGFELDELVSPVIALEAFIEAGGDASLLNEPEVKKAVELILRRLKAERHGEHSLYSTFLQPTDDEIVYPYLCYNNVLVWRAMKALSRLYPGEYACLEAEAEEVRKAIYTHFVFKNDEGRPFFCWSADLQGGHNVYDEPPGSLQLLPYYGFCSTEDEIWRNTVSMIRSPDYEYSFHGCPIAQIGCAHAPYPWVLSLCNSLLCGYEAEALSQLEIMEMDNGIACESVDAYTGKCRTGAAFATCAGFLCHSMYLACREVEHEN